MSLLLENIWKMKQQRNQSAQGNCSSQREWTDLHIQSEAAGKELQRDYANPWLGEQWLIARAGGSRHCSVPGQWLCKLPTHSQSAGQLAKWENLWLCISKWAALRWSHPAWYRINMSVHLCYPSHSSVGSIRVWLLGRLLNISVKEKWMFGWSLSFTASLTWKG